MSKDRTVVSGLESITINVLDNGYTVEYNGLNASNAWVSNKIVVTSVESLLDAIKDLSGIPRD